MKKIFLSILIIVFILPQSYSQTAGGIGSNMDLPVLVPQSPEAYALGKYGEVDINESTGSISPSIPLYTYQAGNISVPISLAYSGNGVKVDQRPTTTGINWSLIAGGAITRQVRDRPDEIAYSPTPLLNNREFYTDAGLNDLLVNGDDVDPNSVWAAKMKHLAGNDQIDSEVDIFNYNFMGYSGSFYIDENWEPRLIKYDKEIKIDITELKGTEIVNGITIDKPEITITTLDGVTYLFGGNNDDLANTNSGSEYTRGRNGNNPFNFSEFVLSSMYLVQVSHPNGDTVIFEYEHRSINIPRVGTNQNATIRNTDSATECESSSAPFFAGNYYLPIATNWVYTEIEHGRHISKIISSRTNESIEFNRIDFNGFDNILDQIVVKDSTEIIKKFKLDYHYPTNLANQKDRFFLKSVDEQNSTNQSFGKKYRMNYDMIEDLPELFSFSQDHYGYYNGKSNSHLIPKDINLMFDNYYGQLADKEPDFNFAKRGSLKSITYPTGGSTHFEYESGKDLTNVTSEVIPHQLKIYHNDDYDQTIQSKNKLIAPAVGQNGPEDVPKTQTVTATYNIETNGDIIHHEWVRIEVKDETTSNIISSNDIELENPEDSFNSINGSINFDIIEGTNYRVTLKFVNGVGSSMTDNLSQSVFNDNGVHITAMLDYEYAVDSPPVYADALGIRVKSITNKLLNENVADYKRYYYNTKEKISFENNEYSTIENPKKVFFSKYTSTMEDMIGCDWGGTPTSFVYYKYSHLTLQSSSLTSLFIDDSSKKMYPAVTVSYGGDDFENGGKEMQFTLEGDGIPYVYKGNQIYTNHRDNNSWGNGTKKKEILFDKTNGVIKTLKETFYNYKNIIPTDTIFNHKVMNIVATGNAYPVGPPNIEFINIGLYETYSRWHGMESIVTKKYFDNNVITSTQTYDYQGNLAGLPTHEYSTSSDEISTLKRTYYPDEVISNSSLGHDDLSSLERDAINKLKKDQLFRIGEPVQVEIYRDINNDDTYQVSELLNTQRTSYLNSLLGNPNLILPGFVETAKEGDDLESRITYHSYYDNGNIQELSKKDGAHIVYIWGYNQTKPIAKVENATYAQVASYVLNLQNLSDLDVSEAAEDTLRAALDDFRNNVVDNPNPEEKDYSMMVTTYTYDPLIGITSITDPRCRTIYYHYDEFNRLKFVKDHDGNVLSENEYNYKPQN